ncbi:MAG: hypothetical protein ACTHME_09585 [Candidatus Nitrosocosmicus sp.]
MEQPLNFIVDLTSTNSLYPLIKPEIILGNYFFRWNEKSLGIYSNESAKFKSFIKKMIPYLEPIMKMMNVSSFSNSKNDAIKKEIIDKGQFSISNKYNGRIIFILYMDIDGSATFFREEQIQLNNKIYNKITDQDKIDNIKVLTITQPPTDFDNTISIRWNLGNLLFDRKGKDNTKI